MTRSTAWRALDGARAAVGVARALRTSSTVACRSLLPEPVGQSPRALRGDAEPDDPVFRSRKGGRLTERAVNHMLKKLADRAGVNPKLSARWLRHAHANHAIDRGAALPVVQSTLGHGNVATTSAYLHARPRHVEWSAP